MKQNLALYLLAFGIIGVVMTLMFHGTEYLLQALPMGWRMVIQVVVFSFTASILMSYAEGGKK